MRRITEKTKIREGRGLGDHSKYKPWIKAREIASTGTSSTFPDYKHGREIQLLSQGEVYYYYLFRWEDTVDDIKEQYPLDPNITNEIATRYNYKDCIVKDERLTTDLLVIKTNGEMEAYSIKTDRRETKDPKIAARIEIEREYWREKGVQFEVKYKRDVNVKRVQNIMDVVRYYYISDVETEEDMIRHLIANKRIIVDMDNDYICYKKLLPLLKGCDDDE